MYILRPAPLQPPPNKRRTSAAQGMPPSKEEEAEQEEEVKEVGTTPWMQTAHSELWCLIAPLSGRRGKPIDQELPLPGAPRISLTLTSWV